MNSDARAWPAPAKINLFLHVTGRRGDGYHEIETVFQFLDLADGITLRVRRDGRIRRITDPAGQLADELAGVPEEEDLTARAARALKRATGTPLGVDIGITKRIPLGGGLGGGSSDAATTLVGLDRIWGLGLRVEALAGIGLALGADVPVFVRGQAAFAAGIGEKLTPLPLEEPWYLVIHPGCSVPTADIFHAPDLTRDTSPIRIRTLLPILSPFSLLARTKNDCQAVVCAKYPPVGAALAWLSRFGVAAMTGTGACVFAPFRERREAERVLAMMPNAGGIETGGIEKGVRWRGFVAQGQNRSLLSCCPLNC